MGGALIGLTRKVSLCSPRSSPDIRPNFKKILAYRFLACFPPKTVYVHATHSLTPVNGSFSLSSVETIRSDILKTTAIRLDVVQKLLQDFGYDSMLIRNSGQIWLVVKDPSGRWQSLSLNPREPWRMIGTLVTGSDGYRGMIYKNLTELTKDNTLNLSCSIDINKFIQKDCDPSRYEELKHPAWENKTWTSELQSVLDRYKLSREVCEQCLRLLKYVSDLLGRP